jgi:hypothetical protein
MLLQYENPVLEATYAEFFAQTYSRLDLRLKVRLAR